MTEVLQSKEVLELVFSHFWSMRQLELAAQVCRQWRAVALLDRFWARFYLIARIRELELLAGHTSASDRHNTCDEMILLEEIDSEVSSAAKPRTYRALNFLRARASLAELLSIESECFDLTSPLQRDDMDFPLAGAALMASPDTTRLWPMLTHHAAACRRWLPKYDWCSGGDDTWTYRHGLSGGRITTKVDRGMHLRTSYRPPVNGRYRQVFLHIFAASLNGRDCTLEVYLKKEFLIQRDESSPATPHLLEKATQKRQHPFWL